MEANKRNHAEIWVIAGGKGGTGKTLMASGIGARLSARGRKTVLLDLDMGGPNLHSFFGVGRPARTLSHFFINKTPLAELIVDTGIPNLDLISGDLDSLNSSGMRYAQKQKLFNHIQKLNYDMVIIDLGGGTQDCTIDTFLLADKMIVIAVPEITAVENLYYFVKKVFLQKIRKILVEHGLREMAQKFWLQRDNHGIKNLADLLAHLKAQSQEIRELIEAEFNGLSFYIILNQLKNQQQVPLGVSLCSICRNYFGMAVTYTGYVEYDNYLWRLLDGKQSFWKSGSSQHLGRQIDKVIEKLLSGRQWSLHSP